MCQVCQPPSAQFHHLLAERFISLGCVAQQGFKVAEHKHTGSCLMTECGSGRNCGNSLTLFSVITSEFPTYTHAIAKEPLSLRDTLNILCEGWPFFPPGGKGKNREGRKWEEREKADKKMSDPLGVDLALCNSILCTPPNFIPFKCAHSFSHSQKTHCLKQRSNIITQQSSTISVITFSHRIGRHWDLNERLESEISTILRTRAT